MFLKYSNTKKYPIHKRGQQERDYTIENQRQPNFTRPPPNLENTSIITELQKVGFKTNQEGRQDQELRTQMEIIKNLRETHMKREQEVRSELQTYFNTKIDNLDKAVSKQKQANEEANSRALVTINLQQEELNILQRAQDIIYIAKQR